MTSPPVPDKEWRRFRPMSLCLWVAGLFFCLTAPALAGTVTYAYDRFGNLQTALFANAGSLLYAHDAAGNRMTQMVRHQGRDLCLTVKSAKGRPLADIPVTLVDVRGMDTGIRAVTDSQGRALLDLDGMPPGNYGFTILFKTHAFRSDGHSFPDEADFLLVIDEETLEIVQPVSISVIGEYLSDRSPRESVPVRLYAPDGMDQALEWTTDQDGQVMAWLPERKGVAVARYLGNAYASDPFMWENPVIVIDEGLAWVTVTCQDTPLKGVDIQLFAADGSALAANGKTDDNGQAVFRLPEGFFSFAAQLSGHTCKSEDVFIPAHGIQPVIIATGEGGTCLPIPEHPLREVQVTVAGDFQSDRLPKQGLPVTLNTEDDRPLGRKRITDSRGQAVFSLPENRFTAVAHHLGQAYASLPFQWNDPVITIDEGLARVKVTGSHPPQSGLPIHVYSGAGKSLNLTGKTDTAGTAVFRLPAGEYRFRADLEKEEFWSDSVYLAPHVENPVQIPVDGTIRLTVSKNNGAPLPRIPVTLLDGSGTSLYVSGTTNDTGQAFFDIPEGTYRFEAEYLGHAFRSGRVSVPLEKAASLVIPHRAVVVTVRQVYDQTAVPLQGLKVHLETAEGSDLNTWIKTGTTGTAVFDLPEKPFQFRADYLASGFRSQAAAWQDTAIDIGHGILDLSVTREHERVENAAVYLFSPLGAYLKRYGKTHGNQDVTFTLPAGEYMVMVRDQDRFCWYGDIDVAAHQRKALELPVTADDGETGKTEERIRDHE